jgi:Glycosyl hydrolases family 2, TIM barrel domain/Glycosyl hydrolases family 2, sugar binding domain/Glycosyl hydrolases family 2/Beta galactosidase small chain
MNKLLFRLLNAAVMSVAAHSLSVFANDALQPGLRQYLSGTDKDEAMPWRFFCTEGAQSGYWTNIAVPSNWEMKGFGTLHYQRDAANPPPERGLYQLDFRVPQDWADKRVFLVFEGVMTDTEARISGQPAGPVHQGGFYRFKYEVTKLLNFSGTNRLEVAVDKHSANASVNNAERTGDYWVFGGIYRPVYLEAVPQEFIERVAIDAHADGGFAMDVFANNATNADTVAAQITDLSGKLVGAPFEENVSGAKTTLRTRIDSPQTWTAETPNLYRVEVLLKQAGNVVHRFEQRFGFRTIEVRNADGIYVNGSRVVLKGANRHSFWPDSGRALSPEIHRMDIQAMKDMNMNAVRMSHYPPDESFLDLCDQLGLYVLDELAGWHRAYDTPTGTRLVEEMLTHDVNHPSILFWDNGNEGGWNTNLDNVFLQFDPQLRRVLHPWASFNGLCTAHYLAFDKAQIAAGRQSVYYHDNQELVATNDPTKYIYMPTEFLHGLYDGGAGAGLEDYWQMMMSSSNCAGGFIWALLDEGVKRPDTGKIDVVGNLAPDGILGPYREKEGSFYTIKELWSPIVVTPDANGTLIVENDYDFTDAAQCRFTWQLRKFHQPGDAEAGFAVIAESKASVPSIPPGGSGPLTLKLPGDWKSADALAIRADDPSGRELWTWVWPLAQADSFRSKVSAPAGKSAASKQTDETIEVQAGDLTVRINKKTGFLDGVQRGTQMFSLTNGPRPAAGNAKLTGIQSTNDGPDCVVTASFDGDLSSVVWRVRANGWVQCDYTYAAEGPKDFIGVAFDYPEQLVKHKKWLGNGPYRVWKNRLRGGTLNVWENDYNNTITGWSEWTYPEFKGCFANVRWLQLNTAEGDITAIPASHDLFVQLLTPQLPPTNLVANTKVKLPQAGLAFLNAIPPIGSKFKEPKDSGPQGQPNIVSGQYSGSVNFYFGKVP